MASPHFIPALALVVSVMAAPLAAVPFALAGEPGCGTAVACYEKVPVPVIHRTIQRRHVIEPGLYEVARVPSLYGWRKRRVMVEPGQVIWHETPPVYRTVTITKRVPGGYRWEKRIINGRERLCKVKSPPRTLTVDRKILVSKGRRWAERAPPVYAWTEDRILLRPYKNIAIHTPPHVLTTRERVVIQPEGHVWRKVPRLTYD